MKYLFTSLLLAAACLTAVAQPSLSGIYPHLASYNNEGECGTGAVVPWAGRLWVITYGPHCVKGSSDKLYEITPSLEMTVRPESTGGTPASRLIHRESGQLFIGPYAIDSARNVRVIPYSVAPGRYTGAARDLSDPAGKVCIATMEAGFYRIDVGSLDVETLFADGNTTLKGYKAWGAESHRSLLPGAHGKGCYSGQGRLFFSNNGEASKAALTRPDAESGSLCEWDGERWTVVRRNQFTEITGPGGICGNTDPEHDPVWAVGWDHKSLLLGVRDAAAGWKFFRLPKGSNSYDGAHGWNTEWPRIRDIGTPGEPDYLMTMHGIMWRFPGSFSHACTAGIRPRSAFLKVTGDFARWNDRIVFGCDDTAQKEFLNTRKTKGNIAGPGQSNSNLWFLRPAQLDSLGPATAAGAVWLEEQVAPGAFSEPMLFAGWDERSVWLSNHDKKPLLIALEADAKGDDNWKTLRKVALAPGESKCIQFGRKEKGEWVRVHALDGGTLSASFVYSPTDRRGETPAGIFRGLCRTDVPDRTSGILRAQGNNRRTLGLLDDNGRYYELDATLALRPVDDPASATFMASKMAVPENTIRVEKGSVLIVDDAGRRWRLPLGKTNGHVEGVRICREVATERDLLSCSGTFYELPAENAGGFSGIRPIASHPYHVADYASYRGLLVMTGVSPSEGAGNPHIIRSEDGRAAVWAGAIDDLWQLGRPTGQGGPWVGDRVKAGVASDPYLVHGYSHRKLTLSHEAERPVTFTIQADPTGNGVWCDWTSRKVAPGKTVEITLPEEVSARWMRVVSDTDTQATAWFDFD